MQSHQHVVRDIPETSLNHTHRQQGLCLTEGKKWMRANKVEADFEMVLSYMAEYTVRFNSCTQIISPRKYYCDLSSRLGRTANQISISLLTLGQNKKGRVTESGRELPDLGLGVWTLESFCDDVMV
jgi:hypothetical protein